MNEQRSDNRNLYEWNGCYNSYKDNQDEDIRVAFYARVSTEHEAQVNALENQQSWCYEQLRKHGNWRMTELYTDKGITGTQADKRDGFKRAIEDGKQRKYNLLVVRDVSRFARNCEESLRYAHLLKEYGIEIFFCNDGIWSMDRDGELRLGIMSILAQDESRRISEKVLAGQYISRQKGVLYGTGNILGYRLVKGLKATDNTYEIIDEDAETVRRIFDLYVNHDMGVKKIASTMVAEHRKNASGEVRWDGGKVSRILDNRTYSGYITYGKSHCIDYLKHKRVKADKSEHQYVKAKIPEIVPDEWWQQAQAKKEKNSIYVSEQTRRGKRYPKDKWVKVLKCQCGHSFKRFRWRRNMTGEDVYGYHCNNQVLHRKRSYYEEKGLDGTGYCEVPCIPQWHLDFQLRQILHLLWHNPKSTIEKLLICIKDNYEEIEKENPEKESILREQKRFKNRQDKLLEAFLDGCIGKDIYTQKESVISKRLIELETELAQYEEINKPAKETVNVLSVIEDIRAALEETLCLEGKFVSQELVGQIVDRVVPDESGGYTWFLNVGMEKTILFDSANYTEYCQFIISFDEAKQYRNHYGNIIRRSKWRDIKVQVYLKV